MTGAATYGPDLTDIRDVFDGNLVRLRFDHNDRASQGILIGATVGSPEGVEVGWNQGDLRISTSPSAIWQFGGEPGTTTGWLPVGAGSIDAVIAQILVDIAILQAQVIALQGDVGAINTAITNILNSITVIQGEIADLQDPSVVNLGTTLWEYDLRLEADQVVPAGQFTLDPATWPANAWLGVPGPGTSQFSLLNGVGLRYANDGSSASVFNGIPGATSNCSRIQLLNSFVYDRFSLDSRARLLWTVYFSTLTFVASTQAALAGFWGEGVAAGGLLNNSANRMISARRTISGVTQVSQDHQTNGGSASASSNYTSPPGPTANILGASIGPGNVASSYLGINGEGPVDPNTGLPRPVTGLGPVAYTMMHGTSLVQSSTFGPLCHPTTFLIIGFPTTASVGHVCVAERVRLAYLGSG